MTLRNLGDFITTAIMPETPSDSIYFIMLIVIYFAVRSGPAVIGRCAEILFFPSGSVSVGQNYPSF